MDESRRGPLVPFWEPLSYIPRTQGRPPSSISSSSFLLPSSTMMIGIGKSETPRRTMFLSDSIVNKNYNHFVPRFIPPLERSYYYPFITPAVSDVVLLPRSCMIEPSSHRALPAARLPSEDWLLAPPRRFVVAKNKVSPRDESLPFSAMESGGVDRKNESRPRHWSPSRDQRLAGAHISSLSSRRDDPRSGHFKEGSSSDVPSKIRGGTWEVQSPPLGPLSS